MADRTDNRTEPQSLEPGAPLEVWCPSLERWVDQFDLVEVTDDQVRVRRRTDPPGVSLPALFEPEDIRPDGSATGSVVDGR